MRHGARAGERIGRESALTQVIRRHSRSIGLGIGVGILGAMIIALVMLLQGQSDNPGEVDEASSTTDYEGTPLKGPAPGFRLKDQNGNVVSLSDFRGKVVVLTLLDPVCTDICPIYAHQYRLAYQALGDDAADVAFLAFNANDEETSIDAMATATKKWGLEAVPTWHFLTGSPEALRSVWSDYGLSASGLPKPDKPDEKQHSPAIYIIDQAGQKNRFLSTNFDDARPASALIVKHVRALLTKERDG